MAAALPYRQSSGVRSTPRLTVGLRPYLVSEKLADALPYRRSVGIQHPPRPAVASSLRVAITPTTGGRITHPPIVGVRSTPQNYSRVPPTPIWKNGRRRPCRSGSLWGCAVILYTDSMLAPPPTRYAKSRTHYSTVCVRESKVSPRLAAG